MDDFQTIDLHDDLGQISALTVWYSDGWEFDFGADRFVADCVMTKGRVEIGNWRADLDRPALIAMIGREHIKALEDERAALMEMQEIAA